MLDGNDGWRFGLFWIGLAIVFVTGLLSIDLGRRIVKAKYPHLKEAHFDLALLFLLVLGLLISSWEHLGSERQVVTLQTELDVIRTYTEVSKLNFVGKTGTVSLPLIEDTPISRMLEGAFTVTDGHSRYACDPAAVGKFHEVIERYPKFPFAYYALAFCLSQSGDSSWRGYAIKAAEILSKTTMIDGHHPNHDHPSVSIIVGHFPTHSLL